MNRPKLSAELARALLIGLVVSWAATLVEGVVRGFDGDARSLTGWGYALLLHAWFGLASGLLWGLALWALDRLKGGRPVWRSLLVPGLLFVNAVAVGGYWFNQWNRVPAFGSPAGRLWTAGFGLLLLLPCAVLAVVLWRRQRSREPVLRWPATPGLWLLGVLAIAAPPIIFGLRASGQDGVRREAAEGPPVIVILMDTLRRDHLECFGYPKPTSPNLNRLAADAIAFDAATTTSNLTVPSTATLFTGLYPSTHGVLWVENAFRPGDETLAQAFRRAGYRTAAYIGNPVVRPETGFGRGFDVFYPSPPPEWIHRRQTALEQLALRLMHGDYASRPANLVREALFWLERDAKRPPYLYIHFLDPHSPYSAPVEDAAPFLPPDTEDYIRMPPMIWDYHDRGQWCSWEEVENRPNLTPHERDVMQAFYDGEIVMVDRLLGGFFDRLRELDLYDEALIVFLSDHGEEFLDHGGWFHGLSLYEEMVGMPLIIKLPGGAGAGRRTRLPVDMVDILPTICRLAGVRTPTRLQGEDHSEDVLALAAGRGRVERPTSFIERPPHLYGLRMGRWKVIQKTALGETQLQLFDLENDPGETEDATAAYPDTLIWMRRLLRELISQVTPEDRLPEGQRVEPLAPEMRQRLKSLGYIN
ncbi:MAG: sulfatase-like hydrolase/transferase [Candidatus Eisenbacteria bacterium]|nr:sulfatase-like hydrolase/transferase [Candidatus Eisenbacteria bacterium]